MTDIDHLRRALALMESLRYELGSVAWPESERAAGDVRHAERDGLMPWHEALLQVMRDKAGARLRCAEKARAT